MEQVNRNYSGLILTQFHPFLRYTFITSYFLNLNYLIFFGKYFEWFLDLSIEYNPIKTTKYSLNRENIRKKN